MRTVHRWRPATLLLCAAALAWATMAQAQDPQPPDPPKPPTGGSSEGHKELDTRVYNTLKDVINRGVDLFNPPTSDWNGCYRLYEGSLMTLRPMLEHRPELQKQIDEGIARARANPRLAQRAYDLRAVLDKVRAAVNPNPKASGNGTKPVNTLWERLGGEENVKKVVETFVVAAASDPKVDFFRGGKYKLDAEGVAHLKKMLVEQISSVSGGPYKYTGKGMKEVHKGMAITNEQFDALAGHLKKALEEHGAKPADVKIVMGVIETTRKDIVEGKEPPTTDKTLWERLGGEENVKKVVDDFVAAAATDPKVDFTRGNKFPLKAEDVVELKKHLVHFVSAATGGPLKYTGRTMKESHKGMGITNEEFDAAAGHLKNALEMNGAKPADVKAVMDAVGKTRADIVEPKPGTGTDPGDGKKPEETKKETAPKETKPDGK